MNARQLELYAELAVKVALNVQPGQRVLIIGPLGIGGASLEAAPLARQIARAAYKAGSPLVEAIWGDEELMLIRFRHAPRESFHEYSAWLPKALEQHVGRIDGRDGSIEIDEHATVHTRS